MADVQVKGIDEIRIVSFKVGNEEYALHIGLVAEVIKMQEITPMPDTSPFMLGVINLRGEVIPIIDLAKRLTVASDAAEDSKILIAQVPTTKCWEEHNCNNVDCPAYGSSNLACWTIANTLSRDEIVGTYQEKIEACRQCAVFNKSRRVGLVVDSVSDVVQIDANSVCPPPDTVSGSDERFVQGVVMLDEGERMLLLLDIAHVVGVIDDMEQKGSSSTRESEADERSSEGDSESRWVCFRANDQDFGVEIMQVQEIIRVPQITSVPDAAPFVDGIINLRGTVIPVLNLRKRFGFPDAEDAQSTRIIIVNVDSQTAGIKVDAVSEVMSLKASQIEPPPQNSEGVDARFIKAIGKLEDREQLLILLNLEEVLKWDEEELQDLQMVEETLVEEETMPEDGPSVGKTEENIASETEEAPHGQGEESTQCAAMTKAGRRCKNQALPGEKYCAIHKPKNG